MQQTVLIAGDTLKYLDTFADYPASAGYVLTTRLVRRDASSAAINFNATASGDDYQTNVPASTTAGWAPGFYTWAKYVTLGGDRYTIDAGELEIRADPATVTAPFDIRSFAERALAAVEAALLGRATAGDLEVSAFGRTVKSMSLTELHTARSRLQREVASERAASDLAKGIKRKNRVLARFRSPS